MTKLKYALQFGGADGGFFQGVNFEREKFLCENFVIKFCFSFDALKENLPTMFHLNAHVLYVVLLREAPQFPVHLYHVLLIHCCRSENLSIIASKLFSMLRNLE